LPPGKPVTSSASASLDGAAPVHFAAGGGERGRVLVLWNDCAQQVGPNQSAWALYGLGGLQGPAALGSCNTAGVGPGAAGKGDSGGGGGDGGGATLEGGASIGEEAGATAVALYIIIDPLTITPHPTSATDDGGSGGNTADGSGLYRVRLYSGDGSVFAPGSLHPLGTNHALLGPLAHGMVVSGRLLGPLVRQTAVNASRRLAAFRRLKLSEAATAATGVEGGGGASSGGTSGGGGAGGGSLGAGSGAGSGGGGGAALPGGWAEDDRWSCPFEARSKVAGTLRRHASGHANRTLGSLLKAVVAPQLRPATQAEAREADIMRLSTASGSSSFVF